MKIKQEDYKGVCPYVVGDKVRDNNTGRRFDVVFVDHSTGDFTLIPNQSDRLFSFWHWSKYTCRYLR